VGGYVAVVGDALLVLLLVIVWNRIGAHLVGPAAVLEQKPLAVEIQYGLGLPAKRFDERRVNVDLLVEHERDAGGGHVLGQGERGIVVAGEVLPCGVADGDAAVHYLYLQFFQLAQHSSSRRVRTLSRQRYSPGPRK